VAAVLLVGAPNSGAARADGPAAGPALASKAVPLLAAKCVRCHGPDEQESGLRLDSLAAALKGGAGFGWLALSAMLAEDAAAGPSSAPAPPEGTSDARQRAKLDLLGRLNRAHAEARPVGWEAGLARRRFSAQLNGGLGSRRMLDIGHVPGRE
jgi:hypothetical protein